MTRPGAILLLAGQLLWMSGCEGDPGLPEPEKETEVQVPAPKPIPVLAHVPPGERDLVEVWAHGDYVYTTTYATSRSRALGNEGNALKIWTAGASPPTLVDSVIVPGAASLTDVQVSDDGGILILSSQWEPGSLWTYDLSNPTRPRLLSRFTSENTTRGVHTAELARVGGKLYAFLSIDPATGFRSRLVIVDLSDPSAPREAAVLSIGGPIVHDVFVRDGLLFTALWDDGMSIWDIGGAGRGGSPERPVPLGNVRTVNGNVHNIWWFHDPSTGSRRYAFVGEESPGPAGFRGDVHVVDVSDLLQPREVAFYSDPLAGVHNFTMDERSGILYAAYYTTGVRAFDVRGDLGACQPAARSTDGRCDLRKMGREVGHAPLEPGVLVAGVYWAGNALYAADLRRGLWMLDVSGFRR